MNCRVCNQPIIIVREPGAPYRFNDPMMKQKVERRKAVHGEGESVKTPIRYVRELRLRLEDSCRAAKEQAA